MVATHPRPAPSGSRPPLNLSTCSPAELGAVVHAACREIGRDTTERFGARKVFVIAVFRALARRELLRGDIRVGTLTGFKARLINAQRDGHVVLARADLIAAMDREVVEFSEIESRGATYHFVIDPQAREPWEVGS
jgi:hypothetical protein